MYSCEALVHGFKLNLEKGEVEVTECSHGEEEISAVTNPRDGFVKFNKKKYAIELPNECHCQTYCAPHPARYIHIV